MCIRDSLRDVAGSAGGSDGTERGLQVPLVAIQEELRENGANEEHHPDERGPPLDGSLGVASALGRTVRPLS